MKIKRFRINSQSHSNVKPEKEWYPTYEEAMASLKRIACSVSRSDGYIEITGPMVNTVGKDGKLYEWVIESIEFDLTKDEIDMIRKHADPSDEWYSDMKTFADLYARRLGIRLNENELSTILAIANAEGITKPEQIKTVVLAFVTEFYKASPVFIQIF